MPPNEKSKDLSRHSTGGGEVARYVARHGQPQGRVAKAILVSAVPPLMLKTANNPGGTPTEVWNGFRQALAANRAQFFLDVASGPFYGFNRPGAAVSKRDPSRPSRRPTRPRT